MAATSERMVNGAQYSAPVDRHKMTSILVVDDEPGICGFLKKGLEKAFGLVEVAEDTDTADALCQRCHFDLIITDIRLPGLSGVDWVVRRREQDANTAVIFITAHADLDTAIAALRAGAADFILKPFRLDQIVAAAERCLERRQMRRENFVLKRQVESIFDATGLVGDCERMRSLCQVIKRVAPMPSTVLIEGESGTGKELAARAIHANSGRSGAFVPINCSAVSAELLESELFGHVKGAFTGAHQTREGLFTYAESGTLFLDEIGEMPKAMQGHLLRALEERAVRPLGSNRETAVDVRIIAATNRDLAEEVRAGRFREDLYFRLNVLSLRLPALRERLVDIPHLVQYFVDTLAPQLGVPAPAIGDAELLRLQSYDWPGNVRELKNVVERCLLLNSAPSQCLCGSPGCAESGEADGEQDIRLEAVEKRHILKVLGLQGGNKSAAARKLGISRKTLERKVQAWDAG